MRKLMFALIAASTLTIPAAAQERGLDRIQTRLDVEARVREGFQRLDANSDGIVTREEAQAQSGAARGERRERRHEARRDWREARFARLDANRDGSISRDEFFAPRDRGEREDRRAGRSGRGGERFARSGGFGGFGAGMFERADSDRDGRLSLAEAIAARLERFQRADANNDGQVTADERRAAWSARRGETR